MPLIVFFIVIPFVELMVFAAVSDKIGIWTALLLAFLTAVVGGSIVRQQGLQTILAMRLSMDAGKLPLSELFDGFCLVAAGALLITPGFVTDTIGFLLLVPAMRNGLRTLIKNHTQWAMGEHDMANTTQTRTSVPPSGDIIEGEYEEIDEPRN